MPFWYKIHGEKPEGGRSLFISMHGGGGAPAAVNDGIENRRLYTPKESVLFRHRPTLGIFGIKAISTDFSACH